MTARKRLGSNKRTKKSWTSVLLLSVVLLFGVLFLVYLVTFLALLWNVTSSKSTPAVSEAIHGEESISQDSAPGTKQQEDPSLNSQTLLLRQKLEQNADFLREYAKQGPNQRGHDDKHDTRQTLWRYDDPSLVSESSIYNNKIKMPFLSSIPARHRIPASVSNVSEFFRDPHNVFPIREYLFDYNPSIVKIPWPLFSSPSSGRNVSKSSNSTSLYWKRQKAYYLVSFRVSNKNYCFHPEDRQRMMGEGAGNIKGESSKDYLGLALLTKQLDMLTSVVVNIKSVGFPSAEDFRLFVLHNRVYISTYDLIAPLWLFDRPSTAVAASSVATATLKQHVQNFTMVPSVFGNERKDFNVWVGKQKSCASCSRANACGKNLNYFLTDSISNQSHALVEVWPSPPHLVHGIDLSQPCRRAEKPIQTFASQQSPIRSFATVEEEMFPRIPHSDNRGVFTRGRGGACCIELEHTTGGSDTTKPLLVGIQHVKTPWQKSRRHDTSGTGELQANHYLSSFYAFEPTPPYNLVAQSGYFCLPFASASSDQTPSSPANTIAKATAWRSLKLGNETFPRCPRIHFVSGLILLDNNNQNDEGDVLISYGVNDCYSRFFVISREEIFRLLFTMDTEDVV